MLFVINILSYLIYNLVIFFSTKNLKTCIDIDSF